MSRCSKPVNSGKMTSFFGLAKLCYCPSSYMVANPISKKLIREEVNLKQWPDHKRALKVVALRRFVYSMFFFHPSDSLEVHLSEGEGFHFTPSFAFVERPLDQSFVWVSFLHHFSLRVREYVTTAAETFYDLFCIISLAPLNCSELDPQLEANKDVCLLLINRHPL